MAPKQRTVKSADEVILDVLAYEFAFDDRTEAEHKIRRRLRYYDAGPYEQERVDLLRRFKDEIRGEIRRGRGSRYFVRCHGDYATMEDFNVQRMTQDSAKSYPRVRRKIIAEFISFAVYLYYLR